MVVHESNSSSDCIMCSSCMKYSCLFGYGKSQMFWLTIFMLGLSEGSPYVGVVGGDAYLNWTITSSLTTEIRYIRNVDSNATLIVFYPGAILPSSIPDKRINYTGNLSLDIVSFTLSNITQSDAGKYEFTRNNVDLGGQALVIAENPIITGITTNFASVVAGRDQKLNCSAESKSIPPGYNLTMFSEWKINGGNIIRGFKHNVTGTILTIINVTRAESDDRYTCRAYEDQRKKSDESGEFNLTVLYGPDNMRIIPSEVNLDEGEILNITCFAECNPLCTSYQWQKETWFPPVGSSASYVVKEVNRTHAGVYICTVNNTAIPNSATAETTVRVNYGPDARSVTLRPSNNSYELAESSHLSVNCSADCIPDCEYRWTGPGGSSRGNTGLLSIPQIYRNQSGVFTCTAYNPRITSNSATATISVNVLYGPDTNSFTLSPNNISYELVEYSHFTVNCFTECAPACEYRWIGPGGSSHGNTGLLSIPQIYRNQTGVFTCIAYNPRVTSNSATATISVIVLYGPDSPLQLIPPKTLYRLEETMQTSDIKCFSDCFPSCNFQWTGPVSSSTGVIAIGTVERSKSGNYTCMGKNPRTQNQASSVTVTFIVIYNTGADVLPIGAIAGGISGAVVAVVLAILVLIFLRRGGLNSKQKGNDLTRELQTMERPDSELVDNPVYDSSMSRGAVGAEYAVVVKKTKVDDASNLYAQVDKKTNKKKGREKGKHGQISRGDVYENSNTKEASSDNVHENPGALSSIGPLVSKDALFYADVMLDPPSTKIGKPFIRGLEDRTVYAEIAYNKRGEPLPESDNE